MIKTPTENNYRNSRKLKVHEDEKTGTIVAVR